MTDEDTPGAAGPRRPRPARGPRRPPAATAFDRWLDQIPTIQLEALRQQEPRVLNLPNALTFLRACLVPVILWLLAADTVAAEWWAFGIFLFAAATDSIDGWVARRMHGVTEWGQVADPIADKLLIIGSVASLAAFDRLPWWAVWVILAREVAVTLLRVSLIRRLDLVMPASGLGKAKTVTQVVAVSAFLWPTVGTGAATALLYVAVVFTLWSGIEYAFRAGRLARGAASPDGSGGPGPEPPDRRAGGARAGEHLLDRNGGGPR